MVHCAVIMLNTSVNSNTESEVSDSVLIDLYKNVLSCHCKTVIVKL